MAWPNFGPQPSKSSGFGPSRTEEHDPHARSLRVLAAPQGGPSRLGAARRRLADPHARSLRVLARAAARRGRSSSLSKPAQAGSEPQASAPHGGPSRLGAARRRLADPHARSLRVLAAPFPDRAFPTSITETTMKIRKLALAATLLAAGVSSLVSTSAFAQAKEQYMPVLSYRTGPYAPNGTPIANGIVDYYKLVNARGGINGVKLLIEECETGYDTARSVECYERLKGNHGGAAVIQPWSTGATFAITEKAPADKIPLVTLGYGRSESADGTVFKWNFPLAGNCWVAGDVLVQAIGKKEGGLDKLKGKKIALVYHDSPFGKEALPIIQERAKAHGFELQLLPVTAPGVE